MPATAKAPLVTPVLIAGCIILMLSFAVRASFGVFQIPIAAEFGWARADFSLAIAIQNLLWGLGAPFAGAGPRSTPKCLRSNLLLLLGALPLSKAACRQKGRGR